MLTLDLIVTPTIIAQVFKLPFVVEEVAFDKNVKEDVHKEFGPSETTKNYFFLSKVQNAMRQQQLE